MTNGARTKCVKIKLAAGSVPAARAWAKEINSRKDEVFETLKDEGVSIESAFLLQENDESFLIYFMRSEDIARAHAVGRQSVKSIDVYHKEFKKNYWLERQELECLIDFSIEDAI